MANKKFYVTTPIYYPNDIPHIGHAYTTVAADVLARWNFILGKEVFFLTGVDENAKKVFQVAQEKGIDPKKFIDDLSEQFKDSWKKLNIKYSRFIRTTEEEHKKVVLEILSRVYKKGDIYKGEYEGLYCVGCEAYYTEKDLVDSKCPIHKKIPEKIKEESYFFKLSKYQKKLLELYKKNPEFILPKTKRNETIKRVREGLKDLSISRKDYGWGIKLPFDKTHVTYVWFDALLNYLSGVHYLENKKEFEKFWPADSQIVGKDILWFHGVIWPAMLLSAEIKLPKTIFAHGWWTFKKEKISKSRGKVINIEELISIAGVDPARYFLFRETPFGEDGDFSEKILVERNNKELANKLGNLISRTTALAEKYGIEKCENKLLKKLNLKKIEKHIENYELDKSLSEIFAFIDECNEFIQNEKLWETKDKKKLYQLIDSIKSIAILLWPFIPQSSEKIAKILNFKIEYKNIGKPLEIKEVKKAEILFKKIEENKSEKNEKVKTKKENINKESNQNNVEGILKMSEINFEDWAKIELKVGKITKVEDIKDADKLYKLEIDLGKKSGKRTVCAGLKEHYKKDELKNKNIILFVNLTPRKMKGIESQGMLLAAVSESANGKKEKVVLISPEKDIELGSRVS